MESSIAYDRSVDAKGLACPMPIVRTKKAMQELEPGQVLQVEATDRGSTADMKAWAEGAGYQYIGTIEEGKTLRHFLRKSPGSEEGGRRFARTASNAELQQQLLAGERFTLLDVREAAEYAFEHIQGAVSIPLGQLDERMNELDKGIPVYVVCRTGTRSDMACAKLAANGFEAVVNVIPGMSRWQGHTDGMRS